MTIQFKYVYNNDDDYGKVFVLKVYKYSKPPGGSSDPPFENVLQAL